MTFSRSEIGLQISKSSNALMKTSTKNIESAKYGIIRPSFIRRGCKLQYAIEERLKYNVWSIEGKAIGTKRRSEMQYIELESIAWSLISLYYSSVPLQFSSLRSIFIIFRHYFIENILPKSRDDDEPETRERVVIHHQHHRALQQSNQLNWTSKSIVITLKPLRLSFRALEMKKGRKLATNWSENKFEIKIVLKWQTYAH